MSGFFERGARSGPPDGEHMRIVDPRTARDVRHERIMDALRWRARMLAELAFEGSCPARVGAFPANGRFSGLIEIEVPFRDTADHFDREDVFQSWTRADPVLGSVPLIFVFRPRQARGEEGMPSVGPGAVGRG